MKKLEFYLTNIFLSLFVGLIIYVFLRPETYISDFVSTRVKTFCIDKEIVFFQFFKYYFVDALWAYAMTFSLAIFIDEKISCVISICVCIVWELFQLFSIVNGTFDFVDIIMYLAAVIIAVLIIFFYKKGESHEKHDS